MSGTMAPVPDRLVSSLIREDPDLRDLVEEFVQALPERLRELHEAFAATDWTRCQTLAHRLKGAGGSYGYPVLSDVARLLEERFKAASAEDVTTYFAYLERVLVAARAALDGSPPAPPAG